MISTTNSAASSPERALESGSSKLASGPEPGRIALPARDALQNVAGFDQRFPVLGEEHAVTSFLHVRHEHGLLRIARDRKVQRALRFGIVGVRAKSKQRGRLPTGAGFAEITGISTLQTLRLDGVFFDFARAEHIHADTPTLPFNILQTQQRNIELAIARQV